MDWWVAIGLPADPNPVSPPLGLESTPSAVAEPPLISSVTPSIWQTIKSDSVNVFHSVIEESETAVKDAYGVGKSAVTTVVTDVGAPIKSVLTGTYMYLLLGLVVVAGGLYFIGKGGGIGQAAGFAKL